eukprot:Transcript_20176.p2 GENE.Transcript_20176~~Transcript_20176.p2  ORF type:complete len:450 (-),score=126.81 Transcript_20176:25-1374(-)
MKPRCARLLASCASRCAAASAALLSCAIERPKSASGRFCCSCSARSRSPCASARLASPCSVALICPTKASPCASGRGRSALVPADAASICPSIKPPPPAWPPLGGRGAAGVGCSAPPAARGGAGVLPPAALVRFRARAGFVYLVAVSAAPADAAFSPLKWGTEPSELPTLRYELELHGCSPSHRAAAAPAAMAAATAAPLPELGRDCELFVPTGLAALEPRERLGGGGASRTAHDLRSGNPGETNTVDLRHGAFRAARGSVLRQVCFAYRYLVGYSANTQSPGPCFELRLLDFASMAPTADEEPLASHVLYCSPEFFGVPYSYDRAMGGSPTSYSPPVDVALPLELRLTGRAQRLVLLFRNGRRNLHLQGAAYPHGTPVELRLRLRFGEGAAADAEAGHAAAAPAATPAAAGAAFLLEAMPQLSHAEASQALAAHGGDVDRAVVALLGT